jgi:plasmid stability protein
LTLDDATALTDPLGGSIMVPIWNLDRSLIMATITVKNIPDDLYADLKQAAQQNHRSINSEVIVCVEQALRSERAPMDVEAILARAERLSELTKMHPITDEEFSEAKRAGRL